MQRRSNRARRERSWAQVEQIVGSDLSQLPEFFRNGLYALTRAELPDSEIILAYERCRAWTSNAKKKGYGECECCGTRFPVDAVNAQQVSMWNLDHCKHSRTFRGIVDQRCNRELGDGQRERKWAHVGYVEAHEARLREADRDGVVRDEFQARGAVPD